MQDISEVELSVRDRTPTSFMHERISEISSDLNPNSTTQICCGFVVQQIHKLYNLLVVVDLLRICCRLVVDLLYNKWTTDL